MLVVYNSGGTGARRGYLAVRGQWCFWLNLNLKKKFGWLLVLFAFVGLVVL